MLPRVGVHLDHDAGEGEHQDHKDEADNQAGLGLESVPKEGVEDEEGHVGNHGGGGEVAIEGPQDVLGLLIRVGGDIGIGKAVINIIELEAISSDIPVLESPVGVNLRILKVMMHGDKEKNAKH